MCRRYPPPGALDGYESAELAADGYTQSGTRTDRVIACTDQPRPDWNAGSRFPSAGSPVGLGLEQKIDLARAFTGDECRLAERQGLMPVACFPAHRSARRVRSGGRDGERHGTEVITAAQKIGCCVSHTEVFATLGRQLTAAALERTDLLESWPKERVRT